MNSTIRILNTVFGLGFELFRAYKLAVKKATIRLAIWLCSWGVIGTAASHLGAGSLVWLSIFASGIGIIAWIAVLLPLLLAGVEADKRSSSFHKIIEVSIFILLSTAGFATFVYLTDVWRYPSAFGSLILVFVLLMLAGVFGDQDARHRLSSQAKWFAVLLALIIPVISLVPTRVFNNIRKVPTRIVGAAPSRIPYDAKNFRSIKFFDEIDGTPMVWYGISDDGTVDLFDNPGHHPRTGEELAPITRVVIAKIKEQFSRLETQQKAIDEEKLKSEQTAAAAAKEEEIAKERETATQKEVAERAEQERREVERQQQLLAEQAHSKESATSEERQRQANSQPVLQPPLQYQQSTSLVTHVVTQTVIATDRVRSQDRVEASLTERVKYGGQQFPVGTRLVLIVVDASPAVANRPPTVILQPIRLYTPYRSQSIETVAERVELTPQGQSGVSSAVKKIVGGAVGGAILGALFGGKQGAEKGTLIGGAAGAVVAITTRGPQMDVPAGYPIQLTIKPTPQ